MTTEPQPDDELAALETETSRPGVRLELLGTDELIAAQLACDRGVSDAVEAAADQIAAALETVVDRLRSGGRMLYLGAGTPGRLAVLDAAECVPTFGVGTETVDALIAGGDTALTRAVEGAEDDGDGGADDVRNAAVGGNDVVVGISASGRTPYVLGAVAAAHAAGATTVGITNNAGSRLAAAVDHPIETLTGPEFVTGSTRLKAGTAQKRVLNMLSTIAMIQLGKVHGTLMVDVVATNEKLRVRSMRIVTEATGAETEQASRALTDAGGNAKTAIAAILLQIPAADAAARLAASAGQLGRVLEES
ncbi:MAG: N-acetylmuramic acid 6-phosphate etherase [Nocardioides sp.]|nr:N-acetylmuramic acid 6-phosphate etherase [Nocardioides sp.]